MRRRARRAVGSFILRGLDPVVGKKRMEILTLQPSSWIEVLE